MTGTDNTTSLTQPASAQAASRYQRLRGHLAALKLHAAAEALPTVIDEATTEELSLTAALEPLLAIEVDATEARRLATRLHFASLPTPATLAGFDMMPRRCGPQAPRRTGHLPLAGVGHQHFVGRSARDGQDTPSGGSGSGRRARRLPHLFHHRR